MMSFTIIRIFVAIVLAGLLVFSIGTGTILYRPGLDCDRETDPIGFWGTTGLIAIVLILDLALIIWPDS